MRGQGAAEYLIVLAIVLLVALIAVLLLGGGGHLQAANESESAMYWQGSAKPLAITAWAQGNGTLYMTISNRGFEHIFLRQIKVGNVTADLGAGWSWRSGGSKNVSIPGLPMCGVNSYDGFSYDIRFVYDTVNLPNHVQIGLKPIVGYCQVV